MTPQSVRNYLRGVKLLHVVTGFDFPFYETFELRLTLHGLDRIHWHLPSRALPVTPDLLCALVQCRGSQFDFVFNCAFLFAFFLFACISNLVPVSARSFGDWASDAYKVYLEFSEDAKLRVARRMISAFDE